MRNAFIKELICAAEERDNIVLIVGDLGYGVVESFQRRFPTRFFNAGVAEQNMMGLAAGMASEGYHVFVYSIANFPTFRCAEQIRNDVAYHRLPVTVVAVGGGLAYGNLGYSHHAIQDYSLLRAMPNMLIGAPGDPQEVRACLRYLIDYPQPSYLRLGKAGEPNIHPTVPSVTPGCWLNVAPGSASKTTFLTTGATLELVMRWRITEPSLANYAVHSIPLWSMREKTAQSDLVAAWSHIITVEDHLQDGGFGSWMLEAMLSRPELLTRFESLALNASVCGMVGSQDMLNAAGGLSPAALSPRVFPNCNDHANSNTRRG